VTATEEPPSISEDSKRDGYLEEKSAMGTTVCLGEHVQ